MAETPEFRAFLRAKSNLVQQLSFSLTLLKDECLSCEPQLLTYNEDQEHFGGHGRTSFQEASKLLDIVLARIKSDPNGYYAFRGLPTLQEGTHKSLVKHMDKLLEEERKKETSMKQREPVATARPTYNREVPQHAAASHVFTSESSHPTCSLDDYLRSIPGHNVQSALDQEVQLVDQAMISRSISNWQELVPYFGLNEIDRATILGNNPHSTEVQRQDFLRLWHNRHGKWGATYRGLATAFYAAGKTPMVEKVVEVLGFTVPSWQGCQGDQRPVQATTQPPHKTPPSRVPPRVYPSTKPTIRELMKLLYNQVAPHWDAIGQYLDIPVPALETIRQKNLNDPQRCLLGMLNEWLHRVDPPPTWEAIAEAMTVIGRDDIAQQMAISSSR